MKMVIIIYLVLIILGAYQQSKIVINESLSYLLKCPDESLIKIQSAIYGKISNINTCFKNATNVVQKLCNGNNSCLILSSNSEFGGDPCPNNPKCTIVDYNCYMQNSFFVEKIENKYSNATLNAFYDEFLVSFVLFLNGNQQTDLINIYDGNNYALRLDIYNEFLMVAVFIESYSIKTVTNTWNSIVISQKFINNTYEITGAVNGTNQFSKINANPKMFSDAVLYLFFNCYFNPACNYGYIKMLSVYSETQVIWSQWSEWSQCNASCIITRTRNCSNNHLLKCIGSDTENSSCSNIYQGIWSQWNDWSNCNDTYGYMNRTMKCNIQNPSDWCCGNNFDTMECYVLWTQWRTWSSSNDSYELINRTRECNVSNNIDWCYGNRAVIVENSAFWTQWNDWSSCNNTYGFRNRMRACIVLNVMERCYTSKSESLEFSEVYLLEDETKLSKGNIVATIKKLKKEFSVYFEILPTVFLKDFHSIIQITTGDNPSNFGYRNPGVWLHEKGTGELMICYDINNTTSHCKNTNALKNKSWSSVKISQIFIEGKYMYSTELNGEMIWSEQNSDAREFSNVKVYASNSWNEVQQGFIRNLKIINGNPALWSQCSNWSSCNALLGIRNITYNYDTVNSKKVCYGFNSEILECFAFWSQWSIWTSCNATYGFMNRTRDCNISNTLDGCNGNHSEIKDCYAFWSQWSNWTSCNASHGFTNRTRECNSSTGIDECKGNKYEVKECFVFWSQWSNWTSCNVTQGFINRTRECNSSSPMYSCYGNSSEVKECFAFWSIWSNWTGCNSTYGFMNRTRVCNILNSINQCCGNDTEVMECFVLWGKWNSWTGCNEFNRFMNRSRECKVLNTKGVCFGENSEVIECPAYWSKWSDWTVCNASHGFINRTRECKISNARDWCYVNNSYVVECFAIWAQWSNLISCNFSHEFVNKSHDCKNSNVIDWCHGNNAEIMEWFEKWTTWSECSVTCGVGNRSKYSQHETIKLIKVESCNQISCPEDGMWGEWNKSECSNTCGKGIKFLSRSCDNPRPSYNGQHCIGVSNYTDVCDNNIICPLNGNWSFWSSWSLCSQPCGGGLHSRFRSCSNPVPKFGGQDCNGSVEEFTNCATHNCKSVKLNLKVNFIDEMYNYWYSILTSTESLSLKKKIQDAIAKLYSNRKVNFNVVIHSIDNDP